MPKKPNKIIQVKFSKCRHNKFILDETLDHIKCGICGENLSPMWVIKYYSQQENRLIMNIRSVEAVLKKAEKKNRCKCEKCGEMTRIQR